MVRLAYLTAWTFCTPVEPCQEPFTQRWAAILLGLSLELRTEDLTVGMLRLVLAMTNVAGR